MLLRRDPAGTILISQLSHAWLSGELARAWGGNGFAVPDPRDAMILATSLHDIGWLDWERRPTLNAQTGLPHEFWEVPPELHTGLWAAGVENAATYGAYAALLVSRHGDSIYARTFDPERAGPATTALVRRFLAEQQQRQADFARQLRCRPGMDEVLTDAHLAVTKRFVATLDAMSLHLCWGVADDVVLADVPDATGGVVRLTLSPGARGTIVDPWPFSQKCVSLGLAGRRVRGRFATQAELDEALAAADSTTVGVELQPKP